MTPPSALPRLLGAQLKGKGGTVDSSSITADVIGIYFSAHWCPPCRNFTPLLAQIYNRLKAAGKSLEIIFVSGDRDSRSFEEYYNSMPWLAVPFENQLQVRSLHQSFHVSGIPSLVFVDRSGKVIEKNGREKVNDPRFINTIPDLVDEDIRGLTVDSAIEAVGSDPEITPAAATTAYKTLIRIISNIVQNPGDPRYLELKKTNAAVQSKIGNRRFIRLLKLAGFKEYPESYKCCENVDIAKMKEVRDTLNSIVMSLEG